MSGRALISNGTAWVPYIGGGAEIPLTLPPTTDILMTKPLMTTTVAGAENVVGDYTVECTVAGTVGATAVSFQIGHIDYGLYPATKVGATTTWRANVPWKSALSLADKVTARPEDNAYWIRPHVTTPTGIVKGNYTFCFTNNYPNTGATPTYKSADAFTSDMTSMTTYYNSFDGVWGDANNPDGNPPATMVSSKVHIVMPDNHTSDSADQPTTTGVRWQVQTPANLVDGDEVWAGWSFFIPSDFPTPTSSHISIGQVMGAEPGSDYTRGLRLMIHARTKAGNVGISDMVTNKWHIDQTDRGHGEPELAFTWPFFRNAWVDIVLGMGVSKDPRKGWLEIQYREPNQSALTRHQFWGIAGNYRIPCALIPPNGLGMRVDNHLYRGRGKFTSVSMRFGQLKLGANAAAVDPHSY